MTGPSEESAETTGPPDRQTLRLLEKHLDEDPLVVNTAFEPNANELHTLRAVLNPNRYPARVDEAHLDIRWFESGDFSVHYIETHNDGRWECRWDKQPNDHNDRLHFHPPPDETSPEDLSKDLKHPLDVYSTVFTVIERRIEQLWTVGDNH